MVRFFKVGNYFKQVLEEKFSTCKYEIVKQLEQDDYLVKFNDELEDNEPLCDIYWVNRTNSNRKKE